MKPCFYGGPIKLQPVLRSRMPLSANKAQNTSSELPGSYVNGMIASIEGVGSEWMDHIDVKSVDAICGNISLSVGIACFKLAFVVDAADSKQSLSG